METNEPLPVTNEEILPIDVAISHETLTTSEKNGEIIKDIFEIQNALEPIGKTETNTYHKSKYANYTSVWNACGPLLLARNILTLHTPGFNDATGTIYMDTLFLKMTSGQWIKIRGSAAPKDLGPQSVGSTHTYLKRYNIGSILNLIFVDTDDDGNAASGLNSKKPETPPLPKPLPKTQPKASRGVDGIKQIDPVASGDTADTLIGELALIQNKKALDAWFKKNETIINGLPENLKADVRKEYARLNTQFKELQAA